MPRYIIPFSGEIELDANSMDEASQMAHDWRRFVQHTIVQENYDKLGIRRMSLKPTTEIVEVTEEYLGKRQPRMIIQREETSTP